jgi:HEPN domain-containing protein
MEMRIIKPSADHENYFETFIKSLVEKFRPLQIFCLSQDTYTEEQTGCFRAGGSNHYGHYCLLMVTETISRIDHQVQDFSNCCYKMGTITIICHGKETIAEAIKANSRFFIKVYTSAKLLYNSDGYSNFGFNNQYIPTKAGFKANKHFRHRISLAEGFLQAAGECFKEHQFTVCTFLLHQVVEQCCIALIRIQIAYRSEVHNLYRLLGICRCFSDQPYKLFLTGSPEDQRLFDVLVKSYSSARYVSDFFIPEEDARHLHQRVIAFVALTRSMCIDTIEKLNGEALPHKDSEREFSFVN